MAYHEDVDLRLLEGSLDQNVVPKATPNVPDHYVRDMQRDLNALGYAAGKGDGWFGARTREKVLLFQADARSTLRQSQSTALVPGKVFREEAPVYTGAVDGVVTYATAQEIQRWLRNGWQRPSAFAGFQVVDIRPSLPTHPIRQGAVRNVADIDRIVLHCTDNKPSWDALACAKYDIGPNHISKQGCPTITYTYFINADGLVQKCLSHDVVSWHVGDWNRRGLGVVLAYRATKNPEAPPLAQLAAASELFARLCKDLNLRPNEAVVGHRELVGTGYVIENNERKLRKECPGMKVDLGAFREEVARRMAG